MKWIPLSWSFSLVHAGVQDAATTRPQQDQRDPHPEVRGLGYRHPRRASHSEEQVGPSAVPFLLVLLLAGDKTHLILYQDKSCSPGGEILLSGNFVVPQV